MEIKDDNAGLFLEIMALRELVRQLTPTVEHAYHMGLSPDDDTWASIERARIALRCGDTGQWYWQSLS